MATAEKDLVLLAKQGNKSAMNTLLADNYTILKGYILKLTGDPETAADVVQEAMLRSVLNIGKFEPRAKFSTWLITIATNVYRDMLRKNKVHVQLDENMATHASDVEDEVLSKISQEEVKKTLQQLPYEKRAVFVLKHFHGYKYEEIAVILDIPIGTVRSRLHNAVKSIISQLEKRGIYYEGA